jgi:hypothetical protein
MKHPLSKSQIICVVLLWAGLCYFILVNAEHVDGPTIISLLIATAFIFIPVYKSIKNRK